MPFETMAAEPPQAGLRVGQDAAGHWLVQDRAGRLEGRFVSFAAALSFARTESGAFGGGVEVSAVPLLPQVPFTRVAPGERALPRAA